MLYKFLPSEHAESFVNRGEVLFRSLAYFRKLEDAARGDPNEGVEIQAPSESSILMNLETGARVVGQLPVTSFIDQQRVFAFCCASTFSDSLFAAFNCNACVVIEDPASFFERCSTDLRQRFKDSPVEFLHGAVRYRARHELGQLSDRDPRELPLLKERRFADQDEYRVVFARRSGFKMTTTIGTVMPSFEADIAKGTPDQRLLRMGSLRKIARILGR